MTQSEPPEWEVTDEGAERYTWAYAEDGHVVISLPGIRDLKLPASEGLIIGQMIVDASMDLLSEKIDNKEGGNK